MKKHLIYLSIASVLGFAGCTDVNDEFEGLKEMTTPENVLNKDYTLTAEDYATISALKINGVDANALKAVKTNLYLTSATPAKTVLPVLMNSKWGTASRGSAIKMIYDFGGDTPAYLAAIAAAKTYTLAVEDYKTVWGGVEGVEYLTPEQSPALALPKVLKKKFAEAAEGDMVIAEYAYSEEEPVLELPTFIDEDFGSVTNYENVVLSGWTNFVEKGTKAWVGREYSGNQYIQMTANGSEEDENVAWLVSPKVNLAETVNPTLSFDITIGYFNAACLQVLVSEDYIDDVTTATWTDITANFAIPQEPVKGYGNTAIAGLMDMSAYKKNINIAFKYVGSGNNSKTTTYQIDNLYLGDDNAVKATSISKEDFEGVTVDENVALSGWTNFIEKGTKTWIGKEYSNNKYVQMSANGSKEDENIAWLVSPKIDLTEVANPAFSFDITIGYYNADCLHVLVSEDYADDVTKATWTDITANFTIPQEPVKGYGKTAIAGLMNMSAYKKNINIAFKYVGSGNNAKTTTYQIDNFNIAGYSRTAAAASFMAKAAAADAPAKKAVVVEYADGKWAVNTKAVVLTNADYKAMGDPGSYNNFSSSIPAGNYLPKFLAATYPYANDGDVKAVVYNYYDSDAKKTVVKADEYLYAGEWKYNNIPVETVTEQYAYSGTWMYDPNVTITLTVGRGNGDGHFQALTDWVWDNVDTPAGVTAKGKGYVTSYGNNDYYFGGSEYQNNFDFRPSAWRAQFSAPYEKLTDAQLTDLMWERLPKAVEIMLACVYPDARPVEGLTVVYTVNFGVYDGSATVMYTIQCEVTAAGEFTYVEDSLKKAE